MYEVYLNNILYPVAPSKIETKISGNNNTIHLINEGEVNQLKTNKLSEISFELMLPRIEQYPFANYEKGFHNADYYLVEIEKLMKDKKAFQLNIVRQDQKGTTFNNTSMTVSLENYTIKEDAGEGLDVIVSLNFKQYKEFGPMRMKKKPKKYTTKKGDTLYLIAKKKKEGNVKINDYAKLIYEKNQKEILKKLKLKSLAKSKAITRSLPKGIILTLPKAKAKTKAKAKAKTKTGGKK